MNRAVQHDQLEEGDCECVSTETTPRTKLDVLGVDKRMVNMPNDAKIHVFTVRHCLLSL